MDNNLLGSAASSTTTAPAAKSHFVVLDGLRGVAALLVVVFHLCQTWAGDPLTQWVNHGYLAVDFFFLLSGFVIAYAYDDRWSRMTVGEFFKRRLIRLQPMVVMGSVIGAALFYFSAGGFYTLVAGTPVWKLLLVMVLGCVMLPLPGSMDIRGLQEMFPLNSPAWSLFYEYIANILYACGVRKLSNRVLMVLAVLAAALLFHIAVFGHPGDLLGGWNLDPKQLRKGIVRLLYPFLAGILLMRLGKRIPMRGSFAVSVLLLVAALSWPRLGGEHHRWMNGLYEAFCVIVLFPLIVAIGAGEKRVEGASIRVARFFGDLSYPLYITHFPLIYLYTVWVVGHKNAPAQAAVWGVVLFFTAIAIAYASLKLYDEPVRRWLSRRFLARAV